MSSGERDELETCRACGCWIYPEEEVSFASTDGVILCMECAIHRGGRYDVEEDRWLNPPETDELRVPRSPM